MKIYLACSISGESYDDVVDYLLRTRDFLRSVGYTVYHPMIGKGHLRTEMEFRAKDYRHPVSTNRAIFGRDKWMVREVDVILFNLTKSKTVSIGSMFEMAWGSHFGKHIVAAIPEQNIHQHAFVLQACDIVFPEISVAKDYLVSLIGGII